MAHGRACRCSSREFRAPTSCGHIVATGEGVAPGRIGERVIIRSLQRTGAGADPYASQTFGSECDGGFAQFAKTFSAEAFKVDSSWSNVELSCIPCAYWTAEGLLHRAHLQAERVLITGASGGVGSAAVQLAKRRGATVIAVAGADKAAAVKELGADQVLERGRDLGLAIAPGSIDVVIDVVGGPQWPTLLDLLRPGGRYATAGAIAGPLVELDLRTLYLKDLSLLGCTYQDDVVFENLVRYIEANEIRPLVAKTYPLRDIVTAQEDFLAKGHVGKLVLVAPS